MRELTNVIGVPHYYDMNGHKSWGLVRLELVFRTLNNMLIYL